MCRCPGSSGCVSRHHCRAIATFLEYRIYRQRLCCVRPSSTSQRLIQSFLGAPMVVVAANTARSNVSPSLDVLHLRTFCLLYSFVNLEHISVIDNETVSSSNQPACSAMSNSVSRLRSVYSRLAHKKLSHACVNFVIARSRLYCTASSQLINWQFPSKCTGNHVPINRLLNPT